MHVGRPQHLERTRAVSGCSPGTPWIWTASNGTAGRDPKTEDEYLERLHRTRPGVYDYLTWVQARRLRAFLRRGW